MKATKLSSLILAYIAFVSLADRASADIIVVAPTATTAGSFQITADITFTITTAGNGSAFIFDEWVNSDGVVGGSIYSPDLSISINGNAPLSFSGQLIDNLASTINHVTPNDGYLITDLLFAVLAVGDTVTLKTGVYSLAAAPDFNPQVTQTFTGSMFIVDDDANQISNTVAVPEPGGLVLGLTAGVAGLFLRRRRRC